MDQWQITQTRRERKPNQIGPNSNGLALARAFLDRYQLSGFLEAIVTVDEIERGKPHVAAIPDRRFVNLKSTRKSGLYLLGSPSEMAALINSFISRTTNIAIVSQL